jgi:hypothetical protein
MRKLSLILLSLLLPVAISAGLLSGCSGDRSQADRLSQEAETLRVSATDKLRQATVSIDGLVKGAASGSTLDPDQTQNTTAAAILSLTGGLDDLTQRGAKLDEAARLDLDAHYQDYLTQMKDNNAKLTDTLDAAMDIPRLLDQEQFSLAGWDQIKAQQIVEQIYKMELEIDQTYNTADTARIQAEQIKKDNPESFEE